MKIKKLETELKESEARYRDLFENADDPMYTHDENGFFQTINKAGLIQLGCSEKEVIGTHFSKWLTQESYKIVEERLRKHLAGEPIEQPDIIEVVKSNGEHRWGEARISLIKKGMKIIGIQGVVRDITEKKGLEEKLREYHQKLQQSYEELMEADRAKTEFVSNITHELLTPLTSIKGFVELLGEESIGTINPEQKKSLDIILRNSDRLIRLIKELLDSTRIENNKFVMQLKNVSLENIILKSIQDIHPQANEKQITIIEEIQPLTQIWGDDERLMQVIRNLLINAIKFTPHNGKITINSSSENEYVKISISDTGIGIPKDKLSTIFERFYQVDGSASRKYGGVGLGLSICKSIIDKHNGSIWAQSNGIGSTFHIVLPKYGLNPEDKDNRSRSIK
jgi:PAS domain S-box-containing protein